MSLNTITASLLALTGLSGLNNAAAMSVERFVAEFGAQARAHVEQLDADPAKEGNEKLSDLVTNVETWALSAGWTVTKGFATNFAQSVVSAVRGGGNPPTPPAPGDASGGDTTKAAA